jgi:hypothetical protein
MSTAARTVIGGVFALSLLLVLMIAWNAYCAELRLEARVGRLEGRVNAANNIQPGDSVSKIPAPGNLSALEQAVWAAEYVRIRAARVDHAQDDRTDLAIECANEAVDDLRRARELR